MFQEGDSVLVEYKLGREKTWHEAILKEKKANGWVVIWMTHNNYYGTTTDGVQEECMRPKTNWLEKMEELLQCLTVERMNEIQQKLDQLHERFTTLVAPALLKATEMEARQCRIEHMLDHILQNQSKMLEIHRQLTDLDCGSWDTICDQNIL